MSGIDKNFVVDGPGKIEKDPHTGEPTGILRNCTRYIKVTPSGPSPPKPTSERRLLELLQRL